MSWVRMRTAEATERPWAQVMYTCPPLVMYAAEMKGVASAFTFGGC